MFKNQVCNKHCLLFLKNVQTKLYPYIKIEKSIIMKKKETKITTSINLYERSQETVDFFRQTFHIHWRNPGLFHFLILCYRKLLNWSLDSIAKLTFWNWTLFESGLYLSLDSIKLAKKWAIFFRMNISTML